jgi:hypothetical protein
MKGSECLVDPQQLLPGWSPQITLAEGIAKVITDARDYLHHEKSEPTRVAAAE